MLKNVTRVVQWVKILSFSGLQLVHNKKGVKLQNVLLNTKSQIVSFCCGMYISCHNSCFEDSHFLACDDLLLQ